MPLAVTLNVVFPGVGFMYCGRVLSGLLALVFGYTAILVTGGIAPPTISWPDKIVSLAMKHLYEDRDETLGDLVSEAWQEGLLPLCSKASEMDQQEAVMEIHGYLMGLRQTPNSYPQAILKAVSEVNRCLQSSPEGARLEAYQAIRKAIGLERK